MTKDCAQYAANIDLDAGRRAFIRSLGIGAAGVAMLGGPAGLIAEAHAAPAPITDTDILNFALNLEYLEAEYYLHAAFGRSLSADEIDGVQGPPGRVIGGRKVPFNSRTLMNFAQEIATDEEDHVKFLRSALGNAKVARPEINLKQSFTDAARAASLIGPDEQFDPFMNQDNFLLGAFIFEDVGVTAYKGAAPLINNKDYLAAAAGILAVEAYHAGEIRTVLYQGGFFKQTYLISALRDSVDGPSNDDQPIGNAQTANIVPSDGNGIAFGRTPQHVLDIVYLHQNSGRGGFFPKGVNGQIRRSA